MSAPNHDDHDRRWITSFNRSQETLAAWLFLMAMLAASRIIYLVALRNYWPAEYSSLDLLKVLARGCRFDCVTASYLCGLPLILGSLAAWWPPLARVSDFTRRAIVACFVVAAPILLLGSIGYYQEFHDHFNPWVFELFVEDLGPIVGVMQSEYWLAQKLAFSAVTAVALWIVYRHFFDRVWLNDATIVQLASGSGRFTVPLGFALALILGIRGSLDWRPLQVPDAGVTNDRFFNNATLNGFYAINSAALERVAEARERSHYPPLANEQIAAAAQSVFYESAANDDAACTGEPGRADDDPLFRVAPGAKNSHPPSQIFLIIMESYDSWPFLDEYRSLGLVENGRRLASQGLHVRAFLPATDHSIGSYLAMTTGLHHTSRSSQRDYATSLPHMFRQLGYTPRLFAGDSATWQHMQEIAASQGYAEYYSAAAVVPTKTGRPRAHDAELFAFVAAHVPGQQRSINVIRTTSNHGPYDLNLTKEDCLIERLPDELSARCNRDQAQLLCHWGHLKYSDKCLGRFVDEMAARFPDALFVITGDHHGRNFIHTQPNDYQATSVPLILYGPRALAGIALPPGVAGSHLDIAPTLVALVAPAGFRFASLGADLLVPRRQFLGISETHAIGSDFIVNFERVPTVEPLPWSKLELSAVRAAERDLPRIVRTHQALEGLSTWLDRQAREASLRDFAPALRR